MPWSDSRVPCLCVMQIKLGAAAEETNFTTFRDIRTKASERPIPEYYDDQSCEQAGNKAVHM